MSKVKRGLEALGAVGGGVREPLNPSCIQGLIHPMIVNNALTAFSHYLPLSKTLSFVLLLLAWSDG